MESPNKRLKQSQPPEEIDADFVPLGGDEEGEKAAQFGYDESNTTDFDTSNAPRGHRAMQHNRNNARNDPRHAKDRPKSKHTLPGHEPWVLVKTKFSRRFVHNTDTKESLWYIPPEVFPAVREFEQWERQQKEKEANAKWAEEQLKDMRGKSQAEDVKRPADKDGRSRRRRSESLQREDEEAMMAELAAEAERAEEEDVKDVVKNVEPLKPVTQQAGEGGYGTDSSYEEVEVTDSEFEEDDGQGQQPTRNGQVEQPQDQDDGPVEFGEDDIAYQLAAMGEDYDLYPPSDDAEAEWYDDQDESSLTADETATHFRTMLNDHNISPFTPWDKLISDTTASSITLDDRYTLLPNMRARKEVWEAWVKDTAARLKEMRARMEKLDPRIGYLAFLAEKATPKLYWPEFKRKYRKEEAMNERRLGEKEREKLYRDHVARLKLAESTRKADLVNLLKSVPLAALNKGSSVDALPQQMLSHLHFISLPADARDGIVEKHIASLPPHPDRDTEKADHGDDEEDAKRRRREKALADRERQVEEERRKVEKEERWAKRDLRDEERELRKAMKVGNRGLKAQLVEDGS